MEAFCSQGVDRSKHRQLSVYSNNYHNGPSWNLRHFGGEYTVANCNRTGQPAFWQDRISPQSCSSTSSKSRSRMCSVILAAASLIVLITILAIGGLAFYMGALHTESPTSNLLTYSGSARILKGDRFLGIVQEKSRRYKAQFETLLQRSILGPGFVSCVIDRFGNDTVYFKLTFDKRRLTRNPTAVEKTVRDILLTDAISRRPVFRNIRFDPKNVQIKLISQTDSAYQRIVANKPTEDVKINKNNMVHKPAKRKNLTLSANLPVKRKSAIEEPKIDEKNLPVIQGSFKITKTEAELTEKKSETTTYKNKLTERHTTGAPKTTTKETSVTSSLYKIAAVEKINKTVTEKQRHSIVASTTIATTSIATTTVKLSPSTALPPTTSTPSQTTPSSTHQTSKIPPLFVFSKHMFDEEPWIPIVPEKPTPIAPIIDFDLHQNMRQPVYTSFTNPALSFHTGDTEKLGSTSIMSHPIPVDKIYTATDASIETKYAPDEYFSSQSPESVNPDSSSHKFVEVETVKYKPSKKPEIVTISNTETKPEAEEQLSDLTEHKDEVKNLSSIFHNLASTLDLSKFEIPIIETSSETVTKNLPVESTTRSTEPVVGHGQVEVILTDEETLLMQTTKLPLVTLIPVKSNSGVGRPLRPLRRRPILPNETSDISIEDRSFPNDYGRLNFNLGPLDNKKSLGAFATEVVTSTSSEISKAKLGKDNIRDYNIVGILNFATEIMETSTSSPDVIRNPKMEAPHQGAHLDNGNHTKVVVHSVNSTIRMGGMTKKNENLLTPDEIKKLSEISRIFDNFTINSGMGDIISNKAISSTYKVNSAGFKILTKTLNKVTENDEIVAGNDEHAATDNSTACSNSSVRCGDGKCLPATTRCNQLIDCNDGVDERNCRCSDYLRSQYLLRKICDGVVDCWDYSDENQCVWCTADQYVCGNSKVCIDKTKICDGIKDCPQGDDERQCVTIAPNVKAANEFPYYSQGYLMVRKYGVWGKLCVENFQNMISRSHISWEIPDLGRAVCKSMTYKALDSIQIMVEKRNEKKQSLYFELAYSFPNKTRTNLSFKESSCPAKKVVMVKCQSLECGARPQAVKHIARRGYRIVGGGNAALGAWPWQAALYKEGEFQCGATLLSDRWLISAGHCFYKSQTDHWVARLGALRRGSVLPSPYEQLRSIVRIAIHPGYMDSGFINDISLLQMEFPVVFSDYVRPICLPPPEEVVADGRICTVIGWGQLFEVGRIFPDTLQEVQVPVISTAECRKRTVFLPLYKITDDMFCAGYERGGRDACLGDSGGPLMCSENNGRWVLQGITSNGYGCARANRPGVYTKVSNYVNWIRSHFENTSYNSTTTSSGSGSSGSGSSSSSSTSGRNPCVGHRCPLGECLPKSRLCNGYIECSDGSDETDC